jgi:hypothetical protein
MRYAGEQQDNAAQPRDVEPDVGGHGRRSGEKRVELAQKAGGYASSHREDPNTKTRRMKRSKEDNGKRLIINYLTTIGGIGDGCG